ncbi:MAG: hypothetical protein KatS3mg105_4506 [Gemmatales bacterium]|nr:MAG: hypothetical protein KatS3mg105_4506 [Gemmatales bacterium]
MYRLFGLALLTVCFVSLSLGIADQPDKKKKAPRQFDPAQFFEKLDANKDGKISKDEYLKILDRVKEKIGADKAEKARGFFEKRFQLLDTNKDGSISKEEFKKGIEERMKQLKGGFRNKGKFNKQGDFKKKGELPKRRSK